MDKKNIKKRYIAVIIAAAIGCYMLFFGNKQSDYQKISGIVWTTEYNITYQSESNLTDSINVIFQNIDNSLSMFNKKSTISRINNNDSLVEPDPYITTLYLRSKEIHKETQGAFDPTVAPLVNLWGFGTSATQDINPNAISEVLAYIGIEKTSIDSKNKIIKEDNRTIFDFSSIAKGFACDEIANMFLRNKVSNFIIEIGGEICAHGLNPQNKDWRISIDQPIEQEDTIIHNSAAVIALTNCGIATSGNYRNYKIIDGKKASHIINPDTGFPEISSLLSATIIAPTAADADAYATACMVLGTNKSISLIEKNKDLEAILIYLDNDGKMRTWNSKGVEELIIK